MDPEDSDSTRWRIHLFGTLEARRPDGTVTVFRGTRAGALLALLCLASGMPRGREELAERLWPDLSPEVKRTRLRQEIAVLRGVFGDSPDSPFEVTRATLRIASERAWIDWVVFREGVARAATAPEEERIALLEASVALCRADLLPDYDEAQGERAATAHTLEQSLLALAQLHRDRGEDAAALEALRRLLERDPLVEEAHAERMRLYARMGQPTQVRRQYQELERALRDALDSEPSEATRRLRDHLLRTDTGQPSTLPPVLTPVPVLLEPAPPVARSRPRGWAAVVPAAALLGLWALLAPRSQAPAPSTRSSVPIVQPLWRYTDTPEEGEKSDSEGTAIVSDGAGGVFVTGFVETVKDDTDILTLHIDHTGKPLWRKRYTSTEHDCDRAFGIARDPVSGEVTVVGESYLPSVEQWRVVTVRYSSNGKKLWTRHSPGAMDNKDHAVRIVALPDGGVIVAGTGVRQGQLGIVLLRYDSKGNQMWECTVPAPGGGETVLSQIGLPREPPFDRVFLCGTAPRPPSASGQRGDAFAACVDASGKPVWSRRLDAPGPGEHQAKSIVADRFGVVWVLGLVDTRKPDGTGGYWPTLWKLSAKDGAQDWVRWKEAAQPMVAVVGLSVNHLQGTASYAVDVIGPGDRRTLTVRGYDAIGSRAWERSFPPPFGYAISSGQRIGTNEADYHLIVGHLDRNQSSGDAWLLTLGPAGETVWQGRVPGGGMLSHEHITDATSALKEGIGTVGLADRSGAGHMLVVACFSQPGT